MKRWYRYEIASQYAIPVLAVLAVLLLFLLGSLLEKNFTFWQNVSTFGAVILGCLVSYYVMVIQGLQARPLLEINRSRL